MRTKAFPTRRPFGTAHGAERQMPPKLFTRLSEEFARLSPIKKYRPSGTVYGPNGDRSRWSAR